MSFTHFFYFFLLTGFRVPQEALRWSSWDPEFLSWSHRVSKFLWDCSFFNMTHVYAHPHHIYTHTRVPMCVHARICIRTNLVFAHYLVKIDLHPLSWMCWQVCILSCLYMCSWLPRGISCFWEWWFNSE